MSERRDDSFRQLHSRLYQYRRERRVFATTVYTLAAIFVVFTTVQWLPFVILTEHQWLFVDYSYISIIGLFVVLLTITAFIFFENVRFLFPLNWILTFVIVEGITCGLIPIVIKHTLVLFATAFGVVAAIVIIFILIGTFIRHDMTLAALVWFVCAIIFFVVSVFFVMMFILVGEPYSLYIYSVLVILTVFVFLAYHAQTINGGRYAEMRLNDFLLAALIIYHDFIILLVMTFYLVVKCMKLIVEKEHIFWFDHNH